ncbi:DUF5005 domain-containing protein [Paraflavitalea sp. CAU 1676]|uniref:DUF5005 domain-containing protein n=1 Tax=Paraflavitalea sp. CAU 1676 TaxID=3032598 RepID=UPI0023DC3481|nr:DUF5005 domain-containing protein [Paraflavitalea sp. CAU 1676]MDF2192304.1 DUF5005 domain-containing protein [Paraflavitalea sp. CAU 1676]
MRLLLPVLLGVILLAGCQKKDLNNQPHEKAILFFTVPNQIGKTEITRTVDTSRVRLTMPTGTDMTAIKPRITVSDGASIFPASGESVNFATNNNKFTYKVTAQDGATRNWLVEIKVIDNTYDSLVLIPNTGKWNEKFLVFHDTVYNNYLTRFSGWNGGDGCVSIPLPNGNVVWSFQDSFFGQVTQDRSRIDNVFVRNAGFIQVGNSTTAASYIQLNPLGIDGKAKTWVTVPGVEDGNKELYWGGPAQVVGNEVQMVMGHLVDEAGVLHHKATDAVVFSLPDMQVKKIVRDRYTGEHPFDASLFKGSDGYTYMYTTRSFPICGSDVLVARAANNDITGEWEYYSKTGWAKTIPANEDFKSILTANATQPNVFERNGKYYLVSQTSCYGLNIDIWEASSPVGPFTNQRTLYQIPEKYQLPEFITYNAVVHHSLSRHGELVISYNINPGDFWSNFNKPGSADRYRPWFVRVFNWQ